MRHIWNFIKDFFHAMETFAIRIIGSRRGIFLIIGEIEAVWIMIEFFRRLDFANRPVESWVAIAVIYFLARLSNYIILGMITFEPVKTNINASASIGK